MIIMFLCLFAIISDNKAYNYQTVYSHRIAFFEENGSVYPLRIDSVKVLNDSILFPFKNIQTNDLRCYNPYGTSWLGGKIVISPTWNYFFNDKNDTIKIKTNAVLSESWTLFNRNDISITATVNSCDTMTFMGVTDSVKTILLHVYDMTMKPTPHALEGKKMILSKNYGFVHTFNFIYWPDFTYYSIYGFNKEFNLCGLTNPELGVQNLTWKEIFNFQPGDEIHKKYTYSPGFIFLAPDNFEIERKTILKYLSRTDYIDSVVYDVDFKSYVKNYNSGVITESYNAGIIKSVVKLTDNPYPFFDKLSLEPIFDNNTANFMTQFTGGVSGKTVPNVYTEIYRGTDSCWNEIIADGCFPAYNYYKGLGGPYYYCQGMVNDSEENTFVYYKKNSTIWGTPLVISGINEPTNNNRINFYPNPVVDKLYFETKNLAENMDVKFYDMQGKLILESEISPFSNSISLTQFQSGLYFYQLSSNGKIFQAGKLSKQ